MNYCKDCDWSSKTIVRNNSSASNTTEWLCHNPRAFLKESVVDGTKFYLDCEWMRGNNDLCGLAGNLFKKKGEL